MELKKGDLIYYEEHKATALLLERFVAAGKQRWSYALRSPKRSEEGVPLWSDFMIGLMSSDEEMILEALNEGRFVAL